MFGISLSTIRARLLVGFVSMALLPAIAISAGSTALGYRNGQQQALERLESVAARKESEISAWVDSLQNELHLALNEEYALERARVVLKLAGKDVYVDVFNKAIRYRFQLLVEQRQKLKDLSLVDLQGRVALSTDPAQEHNIYSDQPFFQQGLVTPYVQLPFDPTSQDHTLAFAAIPIITLDEQLWGVLAGRTSVGTLNDILGERTGLGNTGKAYLVNLNHEVQGAQIGPGLEIESPELGIQYPNVHSTGIDAAVQKQAQGSGVYDDYRGVRVVGVYRWLPELQAALLVEQDMSEAFGAIITTLGVNVGIALASVLLAVGASLLITRGIASPLVNLVDTATQIAAGDLERTAKVEREDEVGALARAFNSMTAQLRDLINSLEARVTERTQALQRRALQLETSAQVSREVTSILEIDALLNRVVELICDAFGYYHVHIYLVDQGQVELVLRASSGPVGPEAERLEIGPGSLNGEAVGRNAALLVNDVTVDPRYLPSAYLPDTRSELVIPLRVGDEVIGTLDVQSAEVNAFGAEDVLVLQSLGDQTAIAIQNARLYDRSRELAVLEERHRLARELHDSVTQSLYSLTLLATGWLRLVRGGRARNIEEPLTEMGEVAQQALKEMRLLVHELRPPALETEGLLGALHQRLGAVEKRAGVEARLMVDEVIEMPAPVEEELYRIAVEALNNALKHAEATSVTVAFRAADGWVELEVADNGRGFNPSATAETRGLGLASMRERAERLGGSLEIQSSPGAGARVSVSVPKGGCART